MKKNIRWYIILPLLVIGAFLLWYFSKLVLYFAIALVLSLLGRPIVDLMRKLKIGSWQLPSGFCAGVVMLALMGILSTFILFITPLLAEQVQNISKIDVKRIVTSVERPLKPVKKIAVQYHFLERGQSFWDYGQEELTHFLSGLNVSNLMSSLVKFAGDIFIALFSISFLTFFLLKDKGIVYTFVIYLTPPGYEEKMSNVLRHSKKLLSRYIIGVIIEEMTVGILVGLGMTFIGADNALLIGFIAGAVNVIPYVGPIIGMMFGSILIICGNASIDFYEHTVPMLIKGFIIYNVIHLLDNMLLQPLIYSSSVKAHPLEIFLVILAAGMAFGIPGLLLAIPVYTLIRVIAKEFLGEFKIIQYITDDIY
ncbi:MAG: AI-2E family transporter [Bacteroidia bacterium]